MARAGASATPIKPKNKIRRQDKYHERLRAAGKLERDVNHHRKREEAKNPRLRAERLAQNVPHTIDNKRTFDEVDIEEGDGIGLSVDVERLKRRKLDADEKAKTDAGELTETNLKKVEELAGSGSDEDEEDEAGSDVESDQDDLGSLMDSEGSDAENDERDIDKDLMPPPPKPQRQPSPPASTTSTNLSHIPDALASRFPSIFHPPDTTKLLITTTIDSTLHHEAELLTRFFPNSDYIRRTSHKYRSHRPSIRDICTGAHGRGYTAVMILGEDKKRPSSLQIVHLPPSPSKDANGNLQFGPTFTFSIKHFVPPSRIAGHGNPTPHFPELLLNNFRTPLGLLTASLFRTLFPPAPEVEGRNVVTFHDQRDYIFVRRHRYVFRNRKETEKNVVGSDGKVVKGAEGIRTGLQELGPRFTLKLRRVDEGVGRVSKRVWEWRAGDEKFRTRFAL